MSAFAHAMESLRAEQELRILELRRHAAKRIELGDLAPDQVEDHLRRIDLREARQRERLSAIVLLHALEVSP